MVCITYENTWPFWRHLGYPLPQPNARVEHSIQQIGEHVGDCEEEHDNHGRGHDDGHILALDSLDQQQAHTKVIKHIFDDHQAANQPADADGDHGRSQREFH